LPAAVKAEIQRLNPSRIYVIGGTGVVSAAVFTELGTLTTTIFRVFGSDRYDTSRRIAEGFFPDGVTGAYIATGRNFPDALGASAVGAAVGQPVVLVDGNAASLDANTVLTLAILAGPGGGSGPIPIKIAGGTGVVSAGIEAQLALTHTVTRLSGATRYLTSTAVNANGYPGPGDATRVFLATGVNFPDALAGSAWAGRVKAPLFIVPGTCVPTDILAHITTLGAFQVTLIGGTGVVSQSVFDLTPCP
jgi:putative cell wall-binding protein